VDHYRWHGQHPFQRRARFTLKADPELSFQPQPADGSLIDIVPDLEEHDVGLDSLRASMRAGIGSQPVTIPVPVARAIAGILRKAPVIRRGPALRAIRERHPDLESAGSAGEDESVDRARRGSGHGARCGR
jgi:hypothetical protein